MSDLHLLTYLNDHLAGSIAGIELAKRCLGNNKDSELGQFLGTLIPILEREQEKLRNMIAALGGYESPFKKFGGWAFEKIFRLKPNNSFMGYSDLSRMLELEALLVGMQAQLGLWDVLEASRSGDSRISSADFSQTRSEVTSAADELRRHYLEAARKALRKSPSQAKE